MRVVFLDIDGVMCTPRAALALGDYGLVRQFDPVAVGFLNRLYEAAPYWIVVSSTWRVETYMPVLLQATGVFAPCHALWRTHSVWAEGETNSLKDRPLQINDWLRARGHNPYSMNHIPIEYLIIDDDGYHWTPEQQERWIKCDSYDGIPLKSMDRAFDLFGARWSQLSRKYPTK